MTSSVIVADDHPLLLQALAELLRGSRMFDVLEATTSGHRALALLKSHRPDIAVLDVSMPGIGGLDILRAVHDNNWPTKVVFLSATMSGNQIASALSLGVWGLLLKDSAADHLLHCLGHVAAGGRWLPDELVAKAQREGRLDPSLRLAELTPREWEIAQLVCQGLSNRAIGSKLGSAEGTVSIHLHNIYRKLEISSRTALVALLVEQQTLAGDRA